MGGFDFNMEDIDLSGVPSRDTTLPPPSTLVADSSYAHLDPRVRAAPGLVIACVGRERCRASYEVERAGFACHGLEFVAEGAGSLRMDKHEHALGPGHLFLYGPNTPHRITTDEKRPMLKYFVDFFGKSAAAELKAAGLAPGDLKRVVEIEAMRRLFEEILREGRKPQETRRAITAAGLRLILAKSRESVHPSEGAALRAQETYERCEAHMENNLQHLRSLEDFSQAVGLAPSHVCRLYRRFARTTPLALLTQRKLARAADLLIARPAPMVKEAAAAVGYEDALYFSRLFTRHFGCGPRAFALQQGRAAGRTANAVR